MHTADQYSIKYHYLHRTARNSKLAFGVRIKGDNILRGVVIWGAPVARLNQKTQLELRRMFLEDSLPKNSESRVLAICIRLIRQIMPQVKLLISYSDLSIGHKGIIYKATGWRFDGRIEPDPNGGWSKHKRHKRSEHGAKLKWVLPL